jgi:hypothetical protein
MITVDTLLIELFQLGIEKLSNHIPNRDKKILISLSKQIHSGHFLTENQSKLLVKILKENQGYLALDSDEKNSAIENPTWSKSFRVIEQVRKIFLSKEQDGQIIVEFTYNKRLRQITSDLNKVIEGQMLSLNSKQYVIPLTEKNAHIIVNTFKKHNFDIDPSLMNFYEEISEILESTKNKFEIFEIKNEKIILAVKEDIGEISEDNLILLNDRRHRYQYTIFQKNPENSLKNAIANRPGTKVWIDPKTTSMTDLVESLVELKRFPVLVIFNGHEAKECIQNLEILSKSLEKTSMNNHVGIYFRFDNGNETNKIFNNTISKLGYNSFLSNAVQVVGIMNNKLPKFMVSSNWQAKSVISFSNNFKNNKTSYYCNDVDLIVYYNERRPLGDIDAIV